MINYSSKSGHTAYGLNDYILDSEKDLEDLPVDIQPGSTAFVITTSSVYMLDSKGNWKEI